MLTEDGRALLAEIAALREDLERRIKLRDEATRRIDADDRRLDELRRSLRRTVVPEKTFRVVPSKRGGSSIDRIWDPNVRWYELVGTPTNADDMREAGYGKDACEPNGMSVAVNVATRHVTTTGGGWFQFPDGTFSRYGERPEEIRAEAQRVWDAIASFVADNPEGGDVTEIVRSHRFLGKEDA